MLKTGPSGSVLMNPKSPQKLYGGRQKTGQAAYASGIYISPVPAALQP
jgi:hypothetical protein